MKKFHAIKTHSFVGVITNSSTELYVCDSDKTIETVRSILEDILATYNKTEKESREFSDVFKEPYIYTEEMLKKHNEERSDWKWGYETEENVGRVIVRGAGDNSIPWGIDSFLESTFSSRYHLG